MSDLLNDPRFWGGVAGALFLGFLVGLFVFVLLSGNDRPRVVGAIRKRCEICEDAWAEPSTDDDVDLCRSCRQAAIEDAGKWGPP